MAVAGLRRTPQVGRRTDGARVPSYVLRATSYLLWGLRHGLTEDFSKSPGSPRTLVPIGPQRRRFGGGLANPLIPGRTA